MRARLRLLAVFSCAGLMAGQMSGQDLARPVDLVTAPPAVTAAVARANAAVQELQATLLSRLSAAMTSGGPTAAIQVCRDEAQQLTAAVSGRHGVEMGRTSDRLRNQANAPRPWAAPVVAAHAGSKVTDASPVVRDLGDRVGVLRPIGTQEFCLTCHGAASAIDASVREVLKSAYPADAAVGFSSGDLRGWIWAEARK